MRGPCGSGPAAGFSLARAASRRRKASLGLSPGRMSEVPSSTGSSAPRSSGGAGGALVNVAGAGKLGTGETGAATVDSAATGVDSGAGRMPLFRRLTGFLPSWSCSHRRRVSRPISIPISRRPPTSDSADSPAWASRSNSSRCASSCAVAWLRGCRAWATAWASVVGRAVVSGEWMGSDMVASGSLYAWWLGRARGAPKAHSKRKRLDVGVLPYFFLLFLFSELSSFFSFVVSWFIGLVDFVVFHFLVLVELVYLSSWFLSLVGRFLSRFFYSSYSQSLVTGGGGC
jgi:hypothetical protein